MSHRIPLAVVLVASLALALLALAWFTLQGGDLTLTVRDLRRPQDWGWQ